MPDILAVIGGASVCVTLAGVAWISAVESSDRAKARRAEREAVEQATQERAYRLALCAQGDHRTTIDAGAATLYERCVDCGMRELFGHAFESGSNKVPRRRRR